MVVLFHGSDNPASRSVAGGLQTVRLTYEVNPSIRVDLLL